MAAACAGCPPMWGMQMFLGGGTLRGAASMALPAETLVAAMLVLGAQSFVALTGWSNCLMFCLSRYTV